MSLYNYYVCGFNGFNQIEECSELMIVSDKTLENPQQLTDSSTTDPPSDTSCSTLPNSSALCTLNAACDQTISEKINHCCHDNKLGTIGNISLAKPSCFNQIQLNSSQLACSHSQSICSPKLFGVEPVLWTWSQIWTESPSGCSYSCHGFNSSSILMALKNAFGTIPKPVIEVDGHHVLMKDGNKYLAVHEGGTVAVVTTDIDDVSILDATRDKIYGTKGNQVFEGQISKSCVDKMRICYTALTMKLQIDTVSCGFEHTLLLSTCGDVFSMGSGSRGQLGHGEVTVDHQSQPRKIQTFEGSSVVAIATGGWHSCAISDMGDLYVWGWNESGQLGITNGSKPHEDTTLALIDTYTECDTQGIDSNTDESGISVAPVQCYGEDQGPLCDKDAVKLETIEKKPLNFQKCGAMKIDSDCAPLVGKKAEELVKTKLYQSIECVQIQTVPYGLEIPDEFSVKKVACGSRHTCILLDNYSVYTTGWNKYGQLCHGDRNSRDVLEMVSYFKHNQCHIVDVKANVWNTVITTKNEIAHISMETELKS